MNLSNIVVILDVAVSKPTAHMIRKLGGTVATHAIAGEPDHVWFYNGYLPYGSTVSEFGSTSRSIEKSILCITNDVGVMKKAKRGGIHFMTLPSRVSGPDLEVWIIDRLDEYSRAKDKAGYINHLNIVLKSQRRSSARDVEKTTYPFRSIALEMKRAGYVD